MASAIPSWDETKPIIPAWDETKPVSVVPSWDETTDASAPITSEPNLGFNRKQLRSPAESFAPSAKTDETRAAEEAATVPAKKVGTDFRIAREKRDEDRRKATAENLKFSNVGTPQPVPGPLTTPGQYAEDVTGIPRAESVVGKAATSIGDVGDALVNVTSVPLLNLLRGKTYDQRMGEKVLESEAGLQGQATVKAAKIRANAGKATEDDKKAIESDKFLNKLHSAYQAVKENPGEAASSLLVGVLEDAPLYILSAPIGGEAIKLAGNVAKEGAAAIRLASLTEKIGTEAATAAEASSAATKATEAALVRSPATVGHIAEKTAEDMVGNVAVGATTSQSRGQKYDAAQLAQDLLASGVMAAGGTLARALRDGRPLSATEFHDLQKAVDVAGIHGHPQILELLPSLKAAASDEKFVSEGGRIRLEKDGRILTHDEALSSGYGEEFLNKIGITPESPGEATGVTKGRDITLYGGADPGTLSEEMTHFWQNVNAEKAAAQPEGPHVVLEQDIREWANKARAESPTPVPESDAELFGQAYEGSLEGVKVPEELKTKFIELAKSGEGPVPATKDPGENFQLRQSRTDAEIAADLGMSADEMIGFDKNLIEFIRKNPDRWGQIKKEKAKDSVGFYLSNLEEKTAERDRQYKEYGDRVGAAFDPSVESAKTKLQESWDRYSEAHGIPKSEAKGALYQLRARKGTPERIEQDRLSAVKVLHAMVSNPGMSVEKAVAATGLKGVEAATTAARAANMVRDMRGSGSYEDALAKDALKAHLTTPAAETLKQTILRTAGEGITGKEIITAKSALHDVVRRLASDARYEDRITKAKAETENVREAGKSRLADQRQAMKDAADIRKALAEDTRGLLPPEIRGQMVTAVANAKTPKDWENGLQKIQDLLDVHEHTQAVNDLKDLLKGTNPRLLRPEYRDRFLEATGGVDPRPLSDHEETRLWRLADWYERAQKAGEGSAEADQLEAIPAAELEKLKRLDKTRIQDMNTEDIRDLANTVQQILHQNELKNNLIGAKDTRVYEKTVNDATEQIVKANPDEAKNSDGITGYLKSAFGMESLSPEVVARIVGGDDGVIHDITYKQPVIAKSLQYRMENGYRGVLKAFFESQGMDGKKLIEWRNEKVKVPLESGETVEMTRPQLVSLYATVQNADNMDAVLRNGIILEDSKGIIGKEFKLSREDIKNTIADMSEFDVKTAETMMTIFESLRPHMNEASVRLEGYEKFTRPRYFPRTADRGFMNRNLTGLGQFWRGGALENLGIGKDIKKHKLPFVLMDATQVFDRHLHDASSYAEMAVPIRNALRVVGNAEVGSSIRKHVGKSADKNIEDFLTDVAGMKGFDLTDAEKTVNSLARRFAVGTLGWRPSTIVNNLIGAPLQIMAEITAKQSSVFAKNMATTSPKRLRELFNEMMVLDGYFEHRYGQDPYKVAVYGGRSHVETIGKSKTSARFQQLQDLSMKPIQDAEKLAGINLYKTLLETTSHAEAVKGMEGFYGKNGFDPSDPDLIKKYAANETMMIVRRTQNAVDDFDKSKFARSLTKSPMASALFMFQSQIFKLRDMSVMAYMDLKRAGGMSASAAEKAKFTKRMGLIVISAALVPTAASFAMRHLREGFKEEDEKKNAQRWGFWASAAFNLADAIHPAVGGAARTVAAGLSGKGFSGGHAGFISESIDGASKAAHALFEGDPGKVYKNLLPAIAITGVPVSGPLPVLEGFYNIVTAGDPLVHLQNERFDVKKKFGVNDDGSPRSLTQALKAGVKITGPEIAKYKQADAIIRRANEIKKNTSIPKNKADEIIKKLTQKKSD